MSFKISNWYNNYQAPSVLMIDDLSDAYIGQYSQSYKNDWGYLCDKEGSAYDYLKKELLNRFPQIKITFFVPYLKHNVIHEHTQVAYKKFDVGEREAFTSFLRQLETSGHEIAHHGSNHGEYIDRNNLSTTNNFKHEWELFTELKRGVEVTNRGKEIFKKHLNSSIVGGKYCGYKQIENSLEIIERCQFLYWCEDVNFNHKDYAYHWFGKNKVLSFPTNFAGNAFVRLSYVTGNEKKDREKKVTQYLQPLYNLLQYNHLNMLYKQGHIISIQEHISPSTSSGMVQSANIISDRVSLHKIYHFLAKKSIWYATCKEISTYIYSKEKSHLTLENNHLIVDFNNDKKLSDTMITICSHQPFTLSNDKETKVSYQNNQQFVVTIEIVDGQNKFMVHQG